MADQCSPFRRIQKIARTIADLAGEESIQISHVAVAIQYRRLGRKKPRSFRSNYRPST